MEDKKIIILCPGKPCIDEPCELYIALVSQSVKETIGDVDVRCQDPQEKVVSSSSQIGDKLQDAVDKVERECCNNCRFCCAQSCRRHAPVLKGLQPNGEFKRDPVWPDIVETFLNWCGDYERGEFMGPIP